MKRWSIAIAVIVLLLWVTPSYVGPSRLFVGSFGLFSAGVGVLAAINAVRAYRRNRYVEDIPTTTIRAASLGLAEVKGRVVPADETIAAPFSERECVLCQYLIDEADSPSARGGRPPADYGLVGVPFFVQDETGKILVRPDGADIRIPRDLLHLRDLLGSEQVLGSDRLMRERGEADEPPISTYAERRGDWRERYELTDRLRGVRGMVRVLEEEEKENQAEEDAETRRIPEGTLEYGEARLEPGDEVYVLGTVQTAEPSSNGREPEEPEILIAEAPDARHAPSPVSTFFAELFGLEKFLRLDAGYGSIFLISTQRERSLYETGRAEVRKKLIVSAVMLVVGFAVAGFAFSPIGL